MTKHFVDYATTLAGAIQATEASNLQRKPLSVDEAIEAAHRMIKAIAGTPNKLMFIGNGGSAGIAGHMAIDFTKNGGVRSVTFNDASSLTCLGNDLGYDQVFSKQVEMQGLAGDILIAISSSGESKNILNAVAAARKMKAHVISLSGFKSGNTLRQTGDINLYVPSNVYGFVETAHQALLHVILDTGMGWTVANPHTQPQMALI